jgi:hypothetical protein
MSQTVIAQWERGFRAWAKADRYGIRRDHLQRLELPDSPELLLEGTIRAVRACSIYFRTDTGDDERFGRFLAFQQYNPGNATDTRYAFTFDLYGKAFARVLVKTKVQTLDLADLYGHAWVDYKVVGYSRFWISHADWSDLSGEELRQLEDEVTRDLRFDYSDDELDFSFDDSLAENYLSVVVQDVHDSEEEDDDQD